MGTLAVKFGNGRSFSWTGEKGDIDCLEAAFREGARQFKCTPENFAENILAEAISQEKDGVLTSTLIANPGAQPWLATAIVWLILPLDSGHPVHAGTIREYLPAADFDVELHHKGGGRFQFSVSAVRHSFDA